MVNQVSGTPNNDSEWTQGMLKEVTVSFGCDHDHICNVHGANLLEIVVFLHFVKFTSTAFCFDQFRPHETIYVGFIGHLGTISDRFHLQRFAAMVLRGYILMHTFLYFSSSHEGSDFIIDFFRAFHHYKQQVFLARHTRETIS